MKRTDFIDAIERLGACSEALELAKKSKGRVTTVARKWVKAVGRRANDKRNYFDWLRDEVRYNSSFYLTPEILNELRNVVRAVDPTFKTIDEERAKTDITTTV